ncbi:MAG: hypothetical protein HYY79_12225 [Betaproteobacteria bacterium]|nr:hypothetical protein [Betaproteobacteria bacterium]
MTERDDQDWFDTLTGKPVNGADPATVREAKALREAMLASQRREPGPEFEVEPGLQRLLFRLRRENLIGDGARRGRWRLYSGFALAASLVLAIGLLVLQPWQVEDDQARFRGGEETQVIVSAEPVQLKDALSRDLHSLNLSPQVREAQGAFVIESQWPRRPEAKHQEFLERHSLRTPAGTRLRIEIHQRPK